MVSGSDPSLSSSGSRSESSSLSSSSDPLPVLESSFNLLAARSLSREKFGRVVYLAVVVVVLAVVVEIGRCCFASAAFFRNPPSGLFLCLTLTLIRPPVEENGVSVSSNSTAPSSMAFLFSS